MQSMCQRAEPASCVMTPENIAAYILHEQDRGATENALRRCRRFTAALYDWLPEDKVLSKERLQAWRRHLKALGYSEDTERNYIKGINRYLDYLGCAELRFQRGKAKDLTGKQFGYLTALEPTGEKIRRDRVWRCRCKCGKEVEYPATRLLTGNVMSCGCLRAEHLQAVNKYFDGTSLRQSVAEQVHSTRASSGYTGVTAKGDKWKAYIHYKGENISLGTYTKLEDAVKARARGKELVQMDAMGLLDFYEELHKNDPARPDREQVRERKQKSAEKTKAEPQPRAKRSNNTSGYPGVCRKRDKWEAKITYRKVTYRLGLFAQLEEAAAARQAAERSLREDPEGFPGWAAQYRAGAGYHEETR